jgi:hypothetical protein
MIEYPFLNNNSANFLAKRSIVRGEVGTEVIQVLKSIPSVAEILDFGGGKPSHNPVGFPLCPQEEVVGCFFHEKPSNLPQKACGFAPPSI